VNIAFIGTGSQGLRVMLGFLQNDDVHAVSVCDPCRSGSGFPQWGKSQFRDSVRQLLGTNVGWEWLSPDDEIKLTPTETGYNGVAGREPCQRIVDACYGMQKRSGNYRGCSSFADFRELLEKEKDVDAVVVGTTDSLHAAVSVAAMKKGKHVFCQKPMSHTLFEARRMADVARETGVATQVAVMNQGSPAQRQIADWISGGAIGAVRHVHNWSNRPMWAQGMDRPTDPQPIPSGLDWNLWLGPAPERPYHSAYLPFVWRGWYDFGCGALGDMGCYSFDTIFRVLKLEAPSSVEAESTERHSESFPQASTIHFEFPARGAASPLRLTWYDGGRKPRADELGLERQLDAEGLVFVGEKGSIVCGFSGNNPRLYPESKQDGRGLAQKRRETGGQRSRGGPAVREWLDACKDRKNKPGARFEFSGVVTETLHLGNLAVRTGQRILWDRAGLKVIDNAAAERLVKPERRPGWELS
jgi:predicted dehydrogenase